MKAAELMIGDKVAYNGNIVSINSVENFGGLVSIENENICDLVPDSELSPIPLTEEILEKNGFKIANRDISKWYISTDAQLIFFDYHLLDDEQPCRLAVPNRGEIKHIRYVHELQHALRLCELRELADNFKV